jgi:hypothetical protein
MRLLALLATAALLAGCVVTSPQTPAAVPSVGQDLAVGAARIHAEAHAAGLSRLQLAEGGEASVTFPPGFLVQDDKGVLRPAKDAVKLAPGKTLTFLPPWNATGVAPITVASGGQSAPLNLTYDDGRRLVSGDLAVTLLKVQRERFPHRTPGMPNYAKAEAYFADFFKALNYTVEVNAYPSSDLKVPVGDQPGPGSAESVLGYKKGTTKADRYLVFGGHFDVVEGTTEGAFDNTAGAVATLAMAQAFANLTTERSIIFAEWGGEEDGIVGSSAWLAAHPDKVPFIDGYVNFDVVALAWPAPKADPAPIVVTAGPDGPVADTLHGYAADLEKTYVRSGAKLVMENWAQHQATGTAGLGGAGVNAQSDHTPFAAHGIPSYFLFTSKVSDVFAIIHSPRDTVDNMTRYSLGGVQAIGQDLSPAEMAEGEWYLARSFEAQMVPMFYYVALTDSGALPVAGLPGAAAMLAG